MTLKSGLNASLGIGDETTWGTAVAPTVHIPLVSESLSQAIERLESQGIIAGQRVTRSQQWSEGAISASGDVGLELNDVSKGLLLKHVFGGSSTTGPFSPADLTGLGLSVQVGMPDTNTGTVRPKTLAGGKVTSWQMALAAKQIATLGLSLAGRFVVDHRTIADGVTTNASPIVTSTTAAFVQNDVGKPYSGTNIPAGASILTVDSATQVTLSANATGTGTVLAHVIGLAHTSPSYASGITPMSFAGGSLTAAGTALPFQQIELAGDNGLKVDRDFVGARTISEPLEDKLRAYTGRVQTEFFSDAEYKRFLAGAEFALSLTIAKGTKSIIVASNIRYDGDTPQVGGTTIIGQSLPFKCIGPTTDAGAITVTLDET